MTFDRIRELASLALDLDARPQWLRDLEGGTIPTEAYFHFMWLVAQAFKPDYSVEIGTRGGKTAMHLGHGNPQGRVLTLDINPGCPALVASLAAEYGVGNVTCLCADSANATHLVQAPIDLLFIDGNHTYESSYGDYTRFRPLVRDGGLIVFDDTRLDEGMTRAWNGIVDPKIELPELHYMGFGVAIKDGVVTP